MVYKIKETCSCGAYLEYEENVEKSYLGKTEDRQIAFHQAHKSCRVNKLSEVIEEMKKKKANIKETKLRLI